MIRIALLTHEMRRANHPCPADQLDSSRPGLAQRPGAGLGGAAAGQHIVDQDHRSSAPVEPHAPRPAALNVPRATASLAPLRHGSMPFSGGESRRRLPRDHSASDAAVDRQRAPRPRHVARHGSSARHQAPRLRCTPPRARQPATARRQRHAERHRAAPSEPSTANGCPRPPRAAAPWRAARARNARIASNPHRHSRCRMRQPARRGSRASRAPADPQSQPPSHSIAASIGKPLLSRGAARAAQARASDAAPSRLPRPVRPPPARTSPRPRRPRSGPNWSCSTAPSTNASTASATSRRRFDRALLIGVPVPDWVDAARRLSPRRSKRVDPGALFAAAAGGTLCRRGSPRLRRRALRPRHRRRHARHRQRPWPLALQLIRRAMRPDAPVARRDRRRRQPARACAARCIDADRADRPRRGAHPSAHRARPRSPGCSAPPASSCRWSTSTGSRCATLASPRWSATCARWARPNMLAERAPARGRDWAARAAAAFAAQASDGRTEERVEILHFIGWSPARQIIAG